MAARRGGSFFAFPSDAPGQFGLFLCRRGIRFRVPVVVALSIAVASIVGGAVLGLLPTRRSNILGPIRTFGLTASVAVVLLHLLPEVYQARGGLTLLAFVAALALPTAFRPLMRVLSARDPDESDAEWVTLRLTYLGLFVHSVADGAALSAYSGHMHQGDAHYDVLVALSAHTVPVVAVMTLTFRDFRGLRLALYGALGLALASSLGVIGAGLVPRETVHGASAWVGAVVAGLLLHVVTHDLGGHAPRMKVERATDLVAALAGIGVGLLSGGAQSHLAHAEGMGPSLGHALLHITLETAPMLLLGLFVAALLQTFGSRIPSAWLRSRGPLRDAVNGALVGIPLPLCSCSVLPISRALEKRRAGPALVVAFLLATPELGVETFALTVRFLGWEYAWLRLVGALVIAIGAALAVGRVVRDTGSEADGPVSIQLDRVEEDAALLTRLSRSFDELLHHIGAWMVLGIIAAAFVQALVPAESLKGLDNPWLELSVITSLTIPSYICAPSATPLAAVLIAKGVSPGAVLVGLLLGPATNLATLIFLKSSYGVRATVLGISTIIAASWGMAFIVNAALPADQIPLVTDAAARSDHWLGYVATGLLVVLLVRSMWRSGTRGWLASMLHGAEAGRGHQHAHTHTHGHAHGI